MHRDALEANVWGLHVMFIDKSSLLIAAPRDDFQRFMQLRSVISSTIIYRYEQFNIHDCRNYLIPKYFPKNCSIVQTDEIGNCHVLNISLGAKTSIKPQLHTLNYLLYTGSVNKALERKKRQQEVIK